MGAQLRKWSIQNSSIVVPLPDIYNLQLLPASRSVQISRRLYHVRQTSSFLVTSYNTTDQNQQVLGFDL